MDSAEAKAVLAQLKDHGRVRRWFGLGARGRAVRHLRKNQRTRRLVRRVWKGSEKVRRRCGRCGGQTSQGRQLFIRGDLLSYWPVGHIRGYRHSKTSLPLRRQSLRQSAQPFSDSGRTSRVSFRRPHVFGLFSASAGRHQAALRDLAARARCRSGDRTPYDLQLPPGKRAIHVCNRYRRPG